MAPIATIPGNGNKVNLDVTSSVAAWSAGTLANFGWGIISTGTNGVDFDSSENGDFADRPMLTINFAPAPAPVPLPAGIYLLLSAIGSFFALRRLG